MYNKVRFPDKLKIEFKSPHDEHNILIRIVRCSLVFLPQFLLTMKILYLKVKYLYKYISLI
jgi:hypothetical protein